MTDREYEKDDNGKYVLDENEQPIILFPARLKTWDEWLGQWKNEDKPNYVPMMHEGYHYYYSTMFHRGSGLKGNELLIVQNSGDVELVDNLPIIEENNN